MIMDENGYYTTEFFHSYAEIEDGDFDDDDDYEYEKEYTWGKVVITPNNIYYLLYFSNKNNTVVSDNASNFLSSMKLKKK